MSTIDEIMGEVAELENAAMAWATESGFDQMTVGPVEAQNRRVRDLITSALADAERKRAEQMRVSADRDCVSHMMVVAGRAHEEASRKAGSSSKSIRRAICTAIAQDKNLRRKLSGGRT